MPLFVHIIILLTGCTAAAWGFSIADIEIVSLEGLAILFGVGIATLASTHINITITKTQ